MNHPVEELFQRKKTDRHLSFTVYIIVILVLIGLLVIIGTFMGKSQLFFGGISGNFTKEEMNTLSGLNL